MPLAAIRDPQLVPVEIAQRLGEREFPCLLWARLEGEIDWSDVARSGLLLIPIWWVWMGVALANDRIAGDALGLRLLTFLNLLAAAALTLTAGQSSSTYASGFALAYVIARTLVIGQAGRRPI